MDTTSQTSVEARRSFLKKAAYVAPAVIVLGALSAPKSAYAGDSGLQQSFTNTAGVSTDLSTEELANNFADSLYK